MENESSKQDEQPAVESIDYEFPCKKCERVFKTKKELIGHESKSHKRGKNKPQQGDFACPYCPKRFKLARGLQGHTRVHRNMEEPKNEPSSVENELNNDDISNEAELSSVQETTNETSSVQNESNNDDTLNEAEKSSVQVEDEIFEQGDDNNQMKQSMIDVTQNLGNFQCEKCEKSFDTNKQLIGHAAKSHKRGRNVIGDWSCCNCLNVFRNFRAFQAHQRFHPRLTSSNNYNPNNE